MLAELGLAANPELRGGDCMPAGYPDALSDCLCSVIGGPGGCLGGIGGRIDGGAERTMGLQTTRWTIAEPKPGTSRNGKWVRKSALKVRSTRVALYRVDQFSDDC
jgi:hypothetical protein